MRFEDGPTVEVKVSIDAPVSKVWEYVRDIDLPARFSTEFKGAEWVDGHGPAVGAKFRGRNELDGVGQWETTSVIVEYEPDRRFAWAVGDPDNASATWRFELESQGDGTFLKYFVQLGPGESGLTAVIARIPDKEERIIERRQEGHRANMLLVVEGIKALAETTGDAAAAPSG